MDEFAAHIVVLDVLVLPHWLLNNHYGKFIDAFWLNYICQLYLVCVAISEKFEVNG